MALVTGGAGFIGSHLAEALLDAGWDVLALDDLSTGRRENIAHLEGCSRFHWRPGSVLDPDLLEQAVEAVDMVFHLAAAVGVRHVLQHPVQAIETNILGTQRLLALCARAGKPLLVTSSSEVYGNQDRPAQREDDDLRLGRSTELRWGYAASKLFGECLAAAYAAECALPVVSVRLFNTIGPRQTGRHGMVVPRFVSQALAGEPITIYGDGTQTRSFSWVGDVVSAMVRLASTPEAFGRVVNLGGEEEIAVRDLARKIRDLSGGNSEIRYIPCRDVYEGRFVDLARRRPDLSVVRALIGYRPSRDLDGMLRAIMDDHRGR